ncbi:hypothetical protein ACJRO7_014864 [Eucalyptus globulus]|uniref:Serine carboxypeptidase-like 18 n=1 Tax=Eucalyptus globulus TaxID=34317 RepID=A0ABD3L7M6_EUCGL
MPSLPPSLVLFLLAAIATAASLASCSVIVKNLPGYSGDLPFTLETGYVGVGEDEVVQLFYYFVESDRSPSQDPLLLWIDGGPGCSSLAGFFFQNGPLNFQTSGYNGSLPSLHPNPYSWTQGMNIIFLDAPVGTGFSYSTTTDGYNVDDYSFVAHSYEFLQKWFVNHTQFLENQFYIGGSSYSGMAVPMLVETIVDGNEAGNEPTINVKGFLMSNPVTDAFIDDNSRIEYGNRMALISDQLYEAAKTNCDGDYVNVGDDNLQCVVDLNAINELTSKVLTVHILEPDCSNALPDPQDDASVRRYLRENATAASTDDPLKGPALWCRNYNHMVCYIWANLKSVQEALQVRPGTKTYWPYCNSTLAYTKVISSVVDYHKNLTKGNIRGLIFSGDHDMSIPHIGTQAWINALNLTLDESWRVWSVDGQTAGYAKKYIKDDYSLTFVTVKGAGHFAAEYKVKECSQLVDRWMAYYPV